jgi:putative oxidoreductase
MIQTPTRSEVSVPLARGAGIRGRFAALLSLPARLPLAVLQLLFRCAITGVFLRAGLQKLASWESTLQLFRDEYAVPLLPPETAAAMSAGLEVGCSVLLLLGLCTRLAALPLLGMILVIQLFVYPQAWSEHLVWGSILLFLLARGGGALALDRLLGLEPDPTPGRSPRGR